jgi:hypothetical protein
MEKEIKDCVLQIKITQTERDFIEKYLLRRSLLDVKRYSLSSFLSMSLMEKLNEDYKKLIEGNTNVY